MTTTTQTVTNRVAAAAVVLLTTFVLLVGIVNQAQAAPISQAGSSSQTTNVPASTPNVSYAAAGARQASNQWGVGARKTAAFSKCISGVGVPIGLVAVLASNPLVWKYVLGRGPLPASVGGTASKYLGAVKKNCAYALF